MQEQIIDLLRKRRKQLPEWILANEIKEMIIKTFNISSCNNISKALSMMRKYGELKFIEIRNVNDLVKIHRTDLNATFDCRRYTFAYKLIL